MSARDAALLELDAKRLPGWLADLLASRKGAPLNDPRDRALADRLAVGVVKNLFFLEELATHYSGQPLEKIDPLARKILAVALYQLRFMDRIPPSAAVNEAVTQARRFGLPRATGFINAVLRNSLRDPAPLAPSAETEPAQYARRILSHPVELFERFARLHGAALALEFCRHNNSEPPTILRLFPGVRVEQLAAEGVSLQPHSSPNMYVVEGARHALLAEWSQAGLAQVQDPTSAAVLAHLDLKSGQHVLDRCCGMGTKTFQLRDGVGPEGKIVAVDPSAPRCAALNQLLAQRKIENVKVIRASTLGPQHAPFDRILIDAPCSNSGTLARRPEARYFQDDNSLLSLAKLQDAILADTAPLLSSGGLLLYSTCSVWPEENEERVAHFQRDHGDYELVEQITTLPSADVAADQYHDGGYVAVLRRHTK
ncbi:MAG: transcription antitermination factor NusB [Tepidisphaeraceae bacterium]|jgi:16S rRNA (cytosine967-C5)-methyltransferase